MNMFKPARSQTGSSKHLLLNPLLLLAVGTIAITFAAHCGDESCIEICANSGCCDEEDDGRCRKIPNKCGRYGQWCESWRELPRYKPEEEECDFTTGTLTEKEGECDNVRKCNSGCCNLDKKKCEDGDSKEYCNKDGKNCRECKGDSDCNAKTQQCKADCGRGSTDNPCKSGCCDEETGECKKGNTNEFCGINGEICGECQLPEECWSDVDTRSCQVPPHCRDDATICEYGCCNTDKEENRGCEERPEESGYCGNVGENCAETKCRDSEWCIEDEDGDMKCTKVAEDCMRTCQGCCGSDGTCYTSSGSSGTKPMTDNKCLPAGKGKPDWCKPCNDYETCENGQCKCNPNSCDGCCDKNGQCLPGLTEDACGFGGKDCKVCSGATPFCNGDETTPCTKTVDYFACHNGCADGDTCARPLQGESDRGIPCGRGGTACISGCTGVDKCRDGACLKSGAKDCPGDTCYGNFGGTWKCGGGKSPTHCGRGKTCQACAPEEFCGETEDEDGTKTWMCVPNGTIQFRVTLEWVKLKEFNPSVAWDTTKFFQGPGPDLWLEFKAPLGEPNIKTRSVEDDFTPNFEYPLLIGNAEDLIGATLDYDLKEDDGLQSENVATGCYVKISARHLQRGYYKTDSAAKVDCASNPPDGHHRLMLSFKPLKGLGAF